MTDCTWCSHETNHPHPCPHQILTKSGKTTDYTPCPCARGLRIRHHIITCTTGCDEPEPCGQPGEAPCPCHQGGPA